MPEEESKEFKFPYVADVPIGYESQTTPQTIGETGGTTLPIQQVPLTGQKGNRGLPLGQFTELTVGAGDKIFRVTNLGQWMGATAYANAPYKVSMAGVLTCTGANVSGTIVATSGRIANWYITTNSITDDASEPAAKVSIHSTNSLIRLGPTTGNYITLDGANQRIRSSNYVSGALGAGFTLEPDLLETGNIRARGKITTSVFEYNSISAVSGDLLISMADKLAEDMSAAD